jgi:hypothetical protein
MSYVTGSPHLSPITGLNIDRPSMRGEQNADLRTPLLQAGQGGLAGRSIAVGDGQARQQGLSLCAKAANAFKFAAKGLLAFPFVLGAAVAGAAVLLATKAICLIPKLISNGLLEPRAEARYKAANATELNALAQPMANSVAAQPGVMDKLVEHAERTGKAISRDELRNLVATGERIAKALQAPGGDHLPLQVTVGDDTHTIGASTYTARAVSWYMMAQAASQDVTRAQMGDTTGTSDMVTEGAMVVKDPGNRMYNFLASAPTACSRMSSHFAERSATVEQHKIAGFIPSGKVSQRGIEDYQGLMPGRGGTILFDRLHDGQDGIGEMFVKFESGGCPPYFKTEPHEGIGHGIARFFAAIDRNVGHATSFIHTRFSSHGGPNEVTRQEHVYKGVLKATIHQGFSELVDRAISTGAIDADAKAVGKSVHKFGLPFVREAIQDIRAGAQYHGQADVVGQCDELLRTVDAESVRLGLASDHLNIERRGAEVHIGL